MNTKQGRLLVNCYYSLGFLLLVDYWFIVWYYKVVEQAKLQGVPGPNIITGFTGLTDCVPHTTDAFDHR